MIQTELDSLSRAQLIEHGKGLGVQRPERMTREELKDEIIRLTAPDEVSARRARGWFGVARDLVAGVVEAGLHMPDAAALIRGDTRFDVHLKGQPPVATVTLAEIYAAQGHVRRAVKMLDEVLEKEPDHEVARELRAKLGEELEQGNTGKRPRAPLGDMHLRRESAVATDEPVSSIASPQVSQTPPRAAEGAESRPPSPEASVIADKRRDEAPLSDAQAMPWVARDMLVLVREGDRAKIVWQMTARSLDRLARQAPEGCASVRVIVLNPTWDGAERTEQDIEIGTSVGERELGPWPRAAALRAALGWRSTFGFTPVTVASVLERTDAGSYATQFQSKLADAATVRHLVEPARAS